MTSESSNVTRGQTLSFGRLAVVATISGLLGGAVAIGMVVLMVWLCNRSWVVDEADSHGISEAQSSRLGGVAIFLGSLAFFAGAEWAAGRLGASHHMFTSTTVVIPEYIGFALLIALVGLWDDFVSRFSPITRLTLVLAISWAAVFSDAVPMTPSTYEWLPLN